MCNTRFFTALTAFVATFIFSAGLVRIIFPAPVADFVYIEQPYIKNCKARSIETFINRDINNGNRRTDFLAFQRKHYGDADSAEFSESVMIYWEKSSGMNAKEFPQDFQDAWLEHMNAWGNYAEFLAQQERRASENNMLIADFEDLEEFYNQEISRTWSEVLRIGRTYGANVR